MKNPFPGRGSEIAAAASGKVHAIGRGVPRLHPSITSVLLLGCAAIPWACGATELVDALACSPAETKLKRLEAQGFYESLILRFGSGRQGRSAREFEDTPAIGSYAISKRNRWILYTHADGRWVMLQGARVKKPGSKAAEELTCEVKSGDGLELP